MKVMVLGAGVIGVTTAYYLNEAGHEVTVDRPPERRRAGDQLRQCRRGLAGLCLALGRARHSAEGDQMAADAPRAAGGAAEARPGDVGLAAQDAAQLHVGRYALNKARMVPLAEYSRDCLRELRQATGIAYDERSQGTLQLFRTQKQVDGTGSDIEVLKQFGVPFEVLDPAGCIAAEPALARGARKDRGRPAGCPATRPATARCSPSGSPQICAERGVTFRFERDQRRLRRRPADDDGRRDQMPRADDGRRLCHGAGQLFAAMAAQAPRPHPGLSGQGLFDHRAGRPTPTPRRCRPSWTRPTRSPSPGSATASGSAARPRFPATT